MEYKALIEFHHVDNGELSGNFSLNSCFCFLLAVCKQTERSLKAPAFFIIIVLDSDLIEIFHISLLCYLNILQAVQATASNM